MERVVTEKKKLSLCEMAKIMGKVLELALGFSFDSDSKVKVYSKGRNCQAPLTKSASF